MKCLLLVILTLIFLTPVTVWSHTGHPHRFMGTISDIKETQLEVTLVDGDVVIFGLDVKTIYRHGKTPVVGKVLSDGTRVVVSAFPVLNGEQMTALTIQLPPV